MTALRFLNALLVGTCIGFAASNVNAAVTFDETVGGDLSGDRLAPTQVSLVAGVNSILATMGTQLVGDDFVTDQEYLRIDLPAGQVLTAIQLQTFDSNDPTAFIGVQSGTIFSFDPDDAFANIGNLLGWSHFGPGEGHDIGDDILPSIASGAGAIGFTPPLTGTSYTFWLQQTGDPTSFRLDFVVVPEPVSCVTLMCGLTLAFVTCQRVLSRRSCVVPRSRGVSVVAAT